MLRSVLVRNFHLLRCAITSKGAAPLATSSRQLQQYDDDERPRRSQGDRQAWYMQDQHTRQRNTKQAFRTHKDDNTATRRMQRAQQDRYAERRTFHPNAGPGNYARQWKPRQASSDDEYPWTPRDEVDDDWQPRRRQRDDGDDWQPRRQGGAYRSGDGGDYQFRAQQSEVEQLNPIDFDAESIGAVKKNFYTPVEDVLARSDDEVNTYMDEYDASVYGRDTAKPLLNFKEASFPSSIESRLEASYSAPTIIQATCWPNALRGRDLVGVAQTGTGKTLGFALPGITHILGQEQTQTDGTCAPRMLVLCPTRELAVQVRDMCVPFCSAEGLSTTACYGGQSRDRQLDEIQRKNPQILIATPGRLLDFVRSGSVDLRLVSYLVLDEADRMLDMGFEGDMRQIVGQIRPDRQTLMFSATWPQEVRGIASTFLNDFIFINVGPQDLSANRNIEQRVDVLYNPRDKSDRLVEFIRADVFPEDDYSTPGKILIFCNTKSAVDQLAHRLRMRLQRSKIDVLEIHGDKRQHTRDVTIARFRESQRCILVATDVAARGLDVPNISVVVNYDFPRDIEDYIHRIGRTGRVENKGISLSFLTTLESPDIVRSLVNVMSQAHQEIPREVHALLQQVTEAKGRYKARKRGYSKVENVKQSPYGLRSRSFA